MIICLKILSISLSFNIILYHYPSMSSNKLLFTPMPFSSSSSTSRVVLYIYIFYFLFFLLHTYAVFVEFKYVESGVIYIYIYFFYFFLLHTYAVFVEFKYVKSGVALQLLRHKLYSLFLEFRV